MTTHPINSLILELVSTKRLATVTEIEAISSHVAQAPFASYLSHVPQRIRQALDKKSLTVPAKLPSVEWHVLERVYLDEQWSLGTTPVQYVADLRQAILHPQAEIWTYRYYHEPAIAFIAPSHLRNAPKPERFLFVSYNPNFASLTTGYQTHGAAFALGMGCQDLRQHR